MPADLAQRPFPAFLSLPGIVANCRPSRVAIAFAEVDATTTETLRRPMDAQPA